MLTFGAGVVKLESATDYRIFFQGENAQLKQFNDYQDRFGQQEDYLIVLTFEDGVFSEKSLQTIREATKLAWLLPGVERVDSLTNFQYTKNHNNELVVEDLFTTPKHAQDPERIESATTDPAINNILLSSNRKSSIVRAQVRIPVENRTVLARNLQYEAEKRFNPFERENEGVKVRLIGQVPYDLAMDGAAQRDSATVYPLLFILAMFLIGIFYRSWSAPASLALVYVGAMITAIGFGGWIGATNNPIVSMAPVMIFVLIACHCVHIFNAYGDLDRGPEQQRAYWAVKTNLRPIALTTLATIAGFLSLNFSQSPPFRDLGNIVAFGCFVGLLWIVFVLPALLSLIPGRVKPAIFMQVISGLQARLIKSDFYRPLIALVVLVPVLMFAIASAESRVSDDYLKYFSKDHSFRQKIDFVNDEVTSLTLLYYTLESRNGVTSANYLNEVNALTEWLRKQPEVSAVRSFSDTMKRINKNMRDGDQNHYLIPESRPLIAQYLLSYELSLPFGKDVNNEITLDRSALSLKIFLRESEGNAVIEMENRIGKWISSNAREIVEAKPAGAADMFSHIGQKNINGMLYGLAITLAVVSVFIGLYYKSLAAVALSLLMNLLPMAGAFGVWAFLGETIDIGVAVVLGMAYGIIVDDTIHILNAWYAHSEELDSKDRMKKIMKKVFPAIYTTTLALAAGFIVLCFSDFNLTFNTGAVTAMTILFAGLVDIFVVPAILVSNNTVNRFLAQGER